MKTKPTKTWTRAKIRKAQARMTAELAEIEAWLIAETNRLTPRKTNLVKSETITHE